MQPEATKGLSGRLPAWLWAVLTVAVVALVVVIAATDRGTQPGLSYKLDLKPFTKVDDKDVAFRQTARFALSVEEPSALAVADNGTVYVAGKDTVLLLDAEGRETARLALLGTPDAMALAPDGKILLGMRNHVRVLDATGKSVADWKDLSERGYITSIAADEKDVFVADAGNRVVLRYDYNGNVLNEMGQRDPKREFEGFVVPSPYFDLAFDASGLLWVVNPGRHGLENHRPTGELVSSWYKPGMDLYSFCGCCNPTHIAFRGDGSVVTAEKGINRVKVYAPDNTLIGVVATPDDLKAPSDENDSHSPVKDLAVDKKDRVLILVGPMKAILVYEPREKAGTDMSERPSAAEKTGTDTSSHPPVADAPLVSVPVFSGDHKQ
jgi:sugar lactone lactonase YvrE